MPRKGAHFVVVGGPDTGVSIRAEGLHIRDSLLILAPGPVTLIAWLVRVPFDLSVAAQVVRTGLGALDVDRCRVAADMTEFYSGTGKPRSGAGHAQGYGIEGVYGGDKANPPHAGGRWPTNLVLVHGSGCRSEGVKRVPASNPTGQGCSGTDRVRGVYMEGDPNSFLGNGGRAFYGTDGLETVPAWACEPGCPVLALDQGSGECRSSGLYPAKPSMLRGGYSHGDIGKGVQGPLYSDSGTASRFFPQFRSLAEALEWLEQLVRAVPKPISECSLLELFERDPDGISISAEEVWAEVEAQARADAGIEEAPASGILPVEKP